MTPEELASLLTPPNSSERRRYLLFGGLVYGAVGGMADLIGAFSTVMEAAAQLPDEPVGWAHLYDVHDRIVVKAWKRDRRDSEDWEEVPTDGIGP